MAAFNLTVWPGRSLCVHECVYECVCMCVGALGVDRCGCLWWDASVCLGLDWGVISLIFSSCDAFSLSPAGHSADSGQ